MMTIQDWRRRRGVFDPVVINTDTDQANGRLSTQMNMRCIGVFRHLMNATSDRITRQHYISSVLAGIRHSHFTIYINKKCLIF